MSWTDGLSKRATNALKRAGFESEQQVLAAFEQHLIKHRVGRNGSATVRGLGRKSIDEVRRWLAKRGHTHMEVSNELL